MAAGAAVPVPEVSCAAALSFDAAFDIVCAQASIGTEQVACAMAGRRVLAAPVFARIDAPRHRVAAMDGYAVRQDDMDAGVTEFRVARSILAGQHDTGPLAPGGAVYVATGADVPDEAGYVVPQEQALVDRATVRLAMVRLGAGALEKRHLRARGSDFAVGDRVVSAGRVVDPRTLVAITAADVGEVEVWRRARVRIITTGDELVPPGAAAATERGVPDSLGEALLLLACEWGAEPAGAAHTRDDPSAIRTAAQAALALADLILIVGGASRGPRDFSKSALAPLGLDLKVDTVAMKPGRPMWYGRIGEGHVIGLPGNPTAAMTVARLLVVPLLLRLGGREAREGLRWRDTPTDEAIPANGPREAFLCGARTATGATVIARQTASAQLMLAQADLLIRRAPDAPALDIGASVQTLRF